MSVNLGDVDVTGLIDMHIHTKPDVRPRLLDDVDMAQQAAEAGMRAIVLKSHITCTADRATIAQKFVPAVKVFGSITLNQAVGGLNPVAGEAALGLGAQVVWMPTISAENHVAKLGGSPPVINLLTTQGNLQPELFDIFELIKQADAILATGHVSVEESIALVSAARAAGVRKVVVTHPEVPWVDMPVNVQVDLREQGAYFERCYVSCLPQGGDVPFARIVSDIRQVGIESTILATDYGRDDLPSAVDGLRAGIADLLNEGFNARDIRLIAGENPARLLGLD